MIEIDRLKNTVIFIQTILSFVLSGKNIKTYDNIWKIVTGQEDDYTIDCLLDYSYFKKHSVIAVDLSRQ